MNFCESIDSTKESSRLRKILSKTVPSYILTQDNKWTEPSEETNNISIFPGCSSSSFGYSNELQGCINDIFELVKLITEQKVLWTIHSFEPYKDAGLDGIIPKMLQVTDKEIVTIL